MSKSDIEILVHAIKTHWPNPPGEKARGYIGQFFNTTRLGTKIAGQVMGNHGTYTVSIQSGEQRISSACSCYIGKHGYCHHCHALALTFLNDPQVFVELKTKPLREVRQPSDLEEYLRGVTLESLLDELKTKGITQKAFAEAIGMSSRHLSSVRSSELRNRYYNELGAIKLSCLWVLEHFKQNKG